MEPKSNLTEEKQQNPLQIHDSSSSEIYIEQKQNPSVEAQRKLSEVFSVKQT